MQVVPVGTTKLVLETDSLLKRSVLQARELDPSVVANVTACVLQYQELDPSVVAGAVADRTTHPFNRAHWQAD